MHDGDEESLRFVTARGLVAVGREVPIRLDVSTADGAWEPGIVELRPEHLEGAYAVAVEAVPETALKRAQIAWAAEHGFTEIVSEMVEANAAMRGVNARLGYRELPEKIVVEGRPP